MKTLRVLLSLVVVAAVMLASALSVSAIGFVAEDIYESVFVVYSGKSLGSGFAIGANCIITNAHVIDNKQDVTIKSYSAKEYEAYVIDMDREKDIAVLGIKDAKFPYLAIADTEKMNTGDDIYAIGAPKSMAYTLTKGVISAKERTVGQYSYIQIDAAINEGNSGGPLLSDNGEVLGMNTLKMSDSEGIGLAIPINDVIDYVRTLDVELDENGNVSEVLTEPEVQETTSAAKQDNVYHGNTNNTKINAILVVGLVFSVILNVVLVILLVNGRKRKVNLTIDPRDRTDFDIDILE